MVYIKTGKTGEDANDMEIQTVLDSYEDALSYAEDNKTYGTQYVAKFTTMKMVL